MYLKWDELNLSYSDVFAHILKKDIHKTPKNHEKSSLGITIPYHVVQAEWCNSSRDATWKS